MKSEAFFGRKVFPTWELASKLLRSGSVDLRKIINHRLKIEKYKKAFDHDVEGRCGKIVMEF